MANLPTPGGSDVWGADLNAAIESLHLEGAHAARPSTDLVEGTLYACTDHSLIYKWDGATWQEWATLGGGGAAADLQSIQADTPHATYGDHFTGSSLNARWTRVGYVSGDEVWDDPGDTWLKIPTARTSTNYYHQAPPAGDFEIVMSAVLHAHTTAVMFGILCMDASTGVAAGVYTNDATANGIFRVNSSGHYDNATNYAGPGTFGMHYWNKMWFRLRKVGSTYYGTVSPNGEVWGKEGTMAGPATPTKIGFGSFFNQPDAFAIDYFDVRV